MTTLPALSGIDELIESRPGYHEGRPHIAGTGISIGGIASLWHQGFTVEEIAYQKTISLEQACAAVAYYLHNRSAIDADLEEQSRQYDLAAQAQAAARARGDNSLG